MISVKTSKLKSRTEKRRRCDVGRSGQDNLYSLLGEGKKKKEKKKGEKENKPFMALLFFRLLASSLLQNSSRREAKKIGRASDGGPIPTDETDGGRGERRMRENQRRQASPVTWIGPSHGWMALMIQRWREKATDHN